MPEELKEQIARFWQGIRRKTGETISRQEAAFVRGKVAGTNVTDEAGGILVAAGHPIDDAVIARAQAAGRMHALTAAAVTAQAQDLRERVDALAVSTPEGREDRELDSVEDFIEARRYVGRVAGLDVNDLRGTVLVPAGKEITEQDVHRCREAGQLAALIYAAQQGGRRESSVERRESKETGPGAEGRGPEGHPTTQPPPAPTPRRTLPLVTPEEDRKDA